MLHMYRSVTRGIAARHWTKGEQRLLHSAAKDKSTLYVCSIQYMHRRSQDFTMVWIQEFIQKGGRVRRNPPEAEAKCQISVQFSNVL